MSPDAIFKPWKTCMIAVFVVCTAWSKSAPNATTFTISFPTAIHQRPITGRVFVFITRDNSKEPRLQAGSWRNSVPIFGADVSELKSGQEVVIDGNTLGYPVHDLSNVYAGEYFIQALMNIYTEFHRSDGKVIWAHMDQWEGQQFNKSPSNLISEVQKVHLDPVSGYHIRVKLTRILPAISTPADTEWVKHVKIQSTLLSRFWGHPIYLGATVLLPKDYAQHSNTSYPVLYEQGHFTLDPPFAFSTEPKPETAEQKQAREARGVETGYDFYKSWNSPAFPRMIVVLFQHPTPFFDDSYAVNSANNGPYGDALIQELIPYIESHFRIIRKPYARILSGGSTGGWESLALQVYHPDFFGGTWTFYPDPIDFRHYCIDNIYEDENAFTVPNRQWLLPERYFMRNSDGQPEVTMRQMGQLEEVLGSHGRSAQQLEIWEAVYGPVGEDGYPRPLWDKHSGKIDHSVAKYMRDNGYDLRYYIQTKWPKIGPQLVGKLHILVGDMDNYYLNLAVYDLEKVLQDTKDPYYRGSIIYGRPEKGHGWNGGMTNAQLLQQMADHIAHSAASDQVANWKYR